MTDPTSPGRARPAEAQEEADEQTYRAWEHACDHGLQQGNPPAGAPLDRNIDRLSQEFPEVSDPERLQQQYDAQMRECGPNQTHPQYEGPGYTEPPFDWAGWHQDHNPHWTFEQWAGDRGYPPEEIATANQPRATGGERQQPARHPPQPQQAPRGEPELEAG
jgi:hypothetical protein